MPPFLEEKLALNQKPYGDQSITGDNGGLFGLVYQDRVIWLKS